MKPSTMEPPVQIQSEHALWMLRTMKFTHQLDLRIQKATTESKAKAATHDPMGREAVAAGLGIHLEAWDQLFCGSGAYAQALAKGMALNELVASLFLRTQDGSLVWDASAPLLDREQGLPGTSTSDADSLTKGIDHAKAAKQNDSRSIAVSCFGNDGREAVTNTGVFCESLHIAASRELPMLFFYESEDETTVPLQEHPPVHSASAIAAQFMPVYRADSRDPFSIYSEVCKAASRVRVEGGPVFVECQPQPRQAAHLIEAGDMTNIQFRHEKDCPILRLQVYLLRSKLLTKDKIKTLECEIEETLDEAISLAQASSNPDSDLLKL